MTTTRVTALVAIALLAACAPKPAPETAPETAPSPRAVRGGRILTERVDMAGTPVTFGAGDLTAEAMASIAPRVAGLVATPSVISLSEGEGFDLENLVIQAFDSTGALLGRLRIYDKRLVPAAARLDGHGIVLGLRPGSAMLLVSYPRALAGSHAGASARLAVPVSVRPRD